MSNLLPPGASQLERRAAEACAGISDLQVPLRDLWNPDRCPVRFLPYLAWAFSVDQWDEKWSEGEKRKTVKDAFYIHSRKGTVAAIRRVIENMGYTMTIREWWQFSGRPGTFRLGVDLQSRGITEGNYQELERLIGDTKPASRHLSGLSINVQSAGAVYGGVGCYIGDALTVYADFPESVGVGGSEFAGAAIHTIETIRISDGD